MKTKANVLKSLLVIATLCLVSCVNKEQKFSIGSQECYNSMQEMFEYVSYLNNDITIMYDEFLTNSIKGYSRGDQEPLDSTATIKEKERRYKQMKNWLDEVVFSPLCAGTVKDWHAKTEKAQQNYLDKVEKCLKDFSNKLDAYREIIYNNSDLFSYKYEHTEEVNALKDFDRQLLDGVIYKFTYYNNSLEAIRNSNETFLSMNSSITYDLTERVQHIERELHNLNMKLK